MTAPAVPTLGFEKVSPISSSSSATQVERLEEEKDAAGPSGPSIPTVSAPEPERHLVNMPKIRKHISIQDQSQRPPLSKILLVYVGIGVALMVSFIDQTSVSTAAPVIGTDLGGSESISWVGTGFFVSNCALHLVYGRLSDIFGRKNMLQIAVFFLAFGNLLCGFAQTPVQLYVFRAISGMGGGGVNGLALIIVSDLVPLKDRGKYQGYIAAATSFGSAVGPFIGGGLASIGQWRWVFWTTTIVGAVCIVMDYFILPLKPVTGSIKQKLKQIDYLGIFLSAAGTVLLLVPISGGGSTFAWTSALVIGMLVVGAVCMAAFIIVQWRISRLPILPLRIFGNRTAASTLAMNFFIGFVYYGNIFYIPIFLQYVLGLSALTSGAYVLAYTTPQTVWGLATGFYVSKTNHYKRLIIAGGLIWCLGFGLQLTFHPGVSIGQVMGILQLNSIGVSCNLQLPLIALLATTATQDRAVVTAARNFLRTMGGAFGLAVSNSIYNNVVVGRLAAISDLTDQQRTDLVNSALQALSQLDPAVKDEVVEAYMGGLKYVYLCFTLISGINWLISLLIKEIPFRKDSPELEAERQRNKGHHDAEKGGSPASVAPASGLAPLPAEQPADLAGGEQVVPDQAPLPTHAPEAQDEKASGGANGEATKERRPP